MSAVRYRWSREYESAEEELVSLLKSNNREAKRWTSEGFEELPEVMYEKDRTLWCVEGSIKYTVDGKLASLQPGDALDISAYTLHSAVTGFSGCVCYESPVENTAIQTA